MALSIDGCSVVVALAWNAEHGNFDEVRGKDHEHCSGGHVTDGVLGGWVCSCPCHRVPEPSEGETP